MKNRKWKTAKGKEVNVSAMDIGWLCNAMAQTIRLMYERIDKYYQSKGISKEVSNMEVISYLNRFPQQEDSFRARWRGLIQEFELRNTAEPLRPGDNKVYNRHTSMLWNIIDMPPALVLYHMYSLWYEYKLAPYNSLRWRQFMWMLKYHRIGSAYFKSEENEILGNLRAAIDDFSSWDERPEELF